MRPIASGPARVAAIALLVSVVLRFFGAGDLFGALAVLLFFVAAPWCWPLAVAMVLGLVAVVWAGPGEVQLLLAVSYACEGAGLVWLAREDGAHDLGNMLALAYLLGLATTAMAWLGGVVSAMLVGIPALVVGIIAAWRLGRRFAS